MAMIRALWDVAYDNNIPDFKEDPYDLGSFDEIAHYRGRRGGRSQTFEASFETGSASRSSANTIVSQSGTVNYTITFGRNGTIPIPVRRHLTDNDSWIEEYMTETQERQIRVGTQKGSWQLPNLFGQIRVGFAQYSLSPLYISFPPPGFYRGGDEESKALPLENSPSITDQDLEELHKLASTTTSFRFGHSVRRPYASAPVRSKPQRTYNPARSVSDPEGDYVPMYLANLYFQDKKGWMALKSALEAFGQTSGLFDEILLKQLGKRESEPFQVQIRKFGDNLKGPPRNLIDVGYGVSQVLPVITELLRRDAPSMFLLQQPEVYLHPSAQAALGTLFCQIAGPRRQIVVETHSDHMLDRVRMEVRDGQGKLKPDDVSILFFERTGLEVRIHSLQFDKQGNVVGAPSSYRQFFMTESQRSLGL